jgi:NADH:ubiquinone reductase (H+-translocating)
MSNCSRFDVVVIGAGHAGVIATIRLLGSFTEAERRRVRVTVVNPRPEFVERIGLHELAAGAREGVMVPLTDVLPTERRWSWRQGARSAPGLRRTSRSGGPKVAA